MSSRDGTSNKEGGEESFFMLQAIQQQFERMNVVFNEIRDRMDKQDAVIATWREGHPQRAPNARRQERRAHVDDFDDDHDDEFEDEDDQAFNGDGDQGTTSKDLIQVPIGPVTRARAKKFKDVLNGLIQELWTQANSWRPIEHDPQRQQKIVTLIQVLEG
jgi:hypothetical protein